MTISGHTKAPAENVGRGRPISKVVSTKGNAGIPRVLFEDNHILVIEKPAGWQSQASSLELPDVLNWGKAYLKDKYDKPGNVFLGLVHRLDLPVSGVLLFGRTSKAARRLSDSIRTHSIEKNYLAWVQGVLPANREGRWEAFLSREADPKVRVMDMPVVGSVFAEMDVRVAEVCADRTLVRVMLGTGRKHQIRAMLAHRGYPVVADRRYSQLGLSEWPREIALRAHSLCFLHPVGGKKIFIECESSDWIETWRRFRL